MSLLVQKHGGVNVVKTRRATVLPWLRWLLLLVGVAVAARAQQPASPAKPPPVRILFVGNSFTHGKYMPVRKYNAAAVIDENAGLPPDDPRAFHPEGEEGPYGGIPGIFKKLADEAGLDCEVHIEAVSAKNLAFHYQHALSVIARPGWDMVVLQGYSTEPLPVERGGKPEDFVKNAERLEKAIHAANPKAKIYLEQTWPRADLVYPEGAPYHGSDVGKMANDLRETCKLLDLKGIEPLSARVGDEWMRAIHEGVAQENPYLPPEPGKLDLWGPDHYHPSVYGAYLAAVVLFCDVAEVSHTTLRPDEQAAQDLGISPADAARLQRFGAVVIDQRPPAGAGKR